MFKYPPALKIVAVFIACLLLLYINHLLFTSTDLAHDLNEFHIIKICVVFYVLVILLFADFYWSKKMYWIFWIWLFLNVAFILNGLLYSFGKTPPLLIQYLQSSSLCIYAFLLLFTKETFPNWLRIFSLSNLTILIPCIYFYFQEMWLWYELLVYCLCFTPLIKSFIFLRQKDIVDYEVLDAN